MSGQVETKPAAGTAGQREATFGAVRHTYFNMNGKPVASLYGTVLRKRVRASIHQLRKPAGWAVDAEILRKARADGARTVEIEDAESGRVFVADIRLFDLYGFEFDRGFGVQIGLGLNYWRIEAADARQIDLFEVRDG